ncbi:CD44 antigen-like isoform X2 [Heterodontus francisci]|uniref:CD44 antigen-like isoform X2 n=1 Tax=Heterodontus francisci TaxID=7792 RepID=UPI00355B568B
MFHRLFIGALGSILVCVQDVKTECRHHGVFQKAAGGRYQLDFQAAKDLCQSLGTTLATLGQLKRAQTAGYETCRYGWIQGGLIAIPRVLAHPVCGKNFQGVLTIQKLLTKKYDVFCFNVTEYENCGSEISSMQNPAEQRTTRISNLPTTTGKSTKRSLQTITEPRLVTPANSHDIVSSETMAAESQSPILTSEPHESSTRSSLQSDIQSIPSPSAAVVYRGLGFPEDQPTRPVSTATPGFTLPTKPGYDADRLNKTTSTSLKKNISVAMNGSGSVGDMELYTESIRGMSLNTDSQDTETKLEYHSGTDLTSVGSIAHPSPSAVFSGNAIEINATIGSTKDNANRLDYQPILESSSTLQINTKNEHESMSGATSTRDSETTQKPTMFEMRTGGTSSNPMTPNPTDLPKENATSIGMFSSKLLPDQRAVSMPNRKETFSISPSPTDLTVESGNIPETLSSESAKVHLDLMSVTVLDTKWIPSSSPSPDTSSLLVESGSTPEILSSESAKVHLDLMSVTVLDTKWIPSSSPSPDTSSLLVESGSTPEILSSEPTEAFSGYSTVLGNNKGPSIWSSPDPRVLFVESGSTPEILKAESLVSVAGLSPDFTVTTEVSGISTNQQTAPGSRGKSDLPVRSTLQGVEVKQTLSERFSGYLSTTAMPYPTTPDRLTSPLHHSPDVSSVVFPINDNNMQEINPTTAFSKQTMVQSKLSIPGLADTTRIYSTPDFRLTASSRATTNRVTQTSSFTVGTQQKAKPTNTKTSDLVILDNEPSRKSRPSTDVGEKTLEASLDCVEGRKA